MVSKTIESSDLIDMWWTQVYLENMALSGPKDHVIGWSEKLGISQWETLDTSS